MKLMLISFLFFAANSYGSGELNLDYSLAGEEETPKQKKKCDKEFKKVCKGEKNIKSCLKKRLTSFSKSCQATMMGRVVKADVEKLNKQVESDLKTCHQEYEKHCGGDGEIDSSCLQKKGHYFSLKCREMLSGLSLDSKENKAFLDNCFGDFEKFCPSDSQENSKKGMADYVSCLEKNMRKMGSQCRKMFDPSEITKKIKKKENQRLRR